MLDKLTIDNVSLYTAQHYDNSQCCSDEEYKKDLKTIKYVKVLLNKIHKKENVNYLILLNHFILLSNIFPNFSFPTLCFFHFDKKSWGIIAAILLFLNRMPRKVDGILNNSIYLSDITLDKNMIKFLREL